MPCAIAFVGRLDLILPKLLRHLFAERALVWSSSFKTVSNSHAPKNAELVKSSSAWQKLNLADEEVGAREMPMKPT